MSRSEKHNTEEIKKNTCFICGLERKDFDNKNVTFEVQFQTLGTDGHIVTFYPGSCQQGAQHVELSVVHRLDKGADSLQEPDSTNNQFHTR